MYFSMIVTFNNIFDYLKKKSLHLYSLNTEKATCYIYIQAI